MILRIRDQCSSTTAKSARAPLAGIRISNRTREGSRTGSNNRPDTDESRMMDLTSLNGENASRPIGGRSAPPHVRRVWFAVLSLRNDVGSQVAAVRLFQFGLRCRCLRSPPMSDLCGPALYLLSSAPDVDS